MYAPVIISSSLLCMRADTATHVVADIVGWLVGWFVKCRLPLGTEVGLANVTLVRCDNLIGDKR